MTEGREHPTLGYLTNEERLKTYQTIIDGCAHLYSKGKPQAEKIKETLSFLIELGQKDPYFLAHLTSWAQKHESRDLKIATIFANSLSSADGRPFSHRSKYKKPNLRYVSAAALLNLDPKMALRVRDLGSLKFDVPKILNEGSHLTTAMKTAIKKYLKFREANLKILEGVKKAGLARIYKNLYRMVHLRPSDEAARILRWQQKDRKIEFKKSPFDFSGLKPIQIAKKIRDDKLPILGVLGALPKITPAIAVALLERATGNQALILRKTFEDAGVLEDREVKELYKSKIGEAKTSIDRVENLSKGASEEVKKIMKQAKSKVRKKETKGLGKVFLHLDVSSSMHRVIDFAKKRGAVIAETVDNPKENFRWGEFNQSGRRLPLPEDFTEDAFAAALFGKVTSGTTDVFACYPMARNEGSEIDVIISDQGHNMGILEQKIRRYHEKNPDKKKPKTCVVVSIPFEKRGIIQQAYEANGIPVAVMKTDALTSSAGVAGAIRHAMLGPMAVIEEILSCPLLSLPSWYFSL